MRGTTPLAAFAFAATLALGTLPAAAQSDILLQARSGSPAGDRLKVDSAGGLVAVGFLGSGVIPRTGAGERLMWYPYKSAFRAGGVSGTEWDDVNIGFYSWAGGSGSTASGTYAFATGNVASASGQAAVALGANVTASGSNSVALGSSLTSNASNAVVLGTRASSNARTGSFTWSDASAGTFNNSANNSFQIRASGGVILYTNATNTVGVSLNPGGSAWNVVSDRNRKHDFMAVDGEDVLARIRTLPVTTWRYTTEEGARHMGPMAQDWHAAFGFNADDKTINMGDMDGVNLAGVQALERRTTELRAQVAERDARIQSLEARVARLEALLQARP